MKEFENNKNEFKLFLIHERGYSELTIKAYLRDLTRYQNFISQNRIEYKEIKKDHIFEFQSYLGSKVGPRSFLRILSCLRTFYKFLHMKGEIKDQPLEVLKRYPSKKIKYKKNLPDFLSRKQIEKIIEKIKLNKKLNEFDKITNQALIMLFFTSGIRLSELISIKLSDIYFSNNEIRILGKGKKQRIVNFDDYTKDLLIQYLTLIKKYPLVKDLYNNNLFVNKDNKPLKRRKIQAIVMNNLKELDLAAYGPHTLRHSFATHLLNNGVAIDAIRSLLGHVSLSSTQIYAKVTTTKLKETIKKSHPRGEK